MTVPFTRAAKAADVEHGDVYSDDGGKTWQPATHYRNGDQTPVLIRLHKPITGVQGEFLDEDEVAWHDLVRLEGRGPWRVIVRFSFEEFGGVVVEDAQGAAYCWNDYVVNNWVETFPTTAQAMARLAVGVDASNRRAFFAQMPEGFAGAAQKFFEEQAQ